MRKRARRRKRKIEGEEQVRKSDIIIIAGVDERKIILRGGKEKK